MTTIFDDLLQLVKDWMTRWDKDKRKSRYIAAKSQIEHNSYKQNKLLVINYFVLCKKSSSQI